MGTCFLPVGYVLMLTDPMHLVKISESIRRVEQIVLDKDCRTKSWHLMAEFLKVD